MGHTGKVLDVKLSSIGLHVEMGLLCGLCRYVRHHGVTCDAS